MYDQPREKVEPAVPSALPPMPASFPRNRLGLAKWLVDEINPFTARVTVNRFWQEVFGTGLVKTAEDFGSQGEAPTHPELLDWLAVEFRESGWDVKKPLQADRDVSPPTGSLRESHRRNSKKIPITGFCPAVPASAWMPRWCATPRSPPVVCSLNKIGGPSVKPYQPDGVWEAVAMPGSNTRHYRRDTGDKLYRRSMYTFWKRSAPPASMDIFNAPSRENCTVRRERTNTPLQALVTMNGTQFVEAARHLAETAIVQGGDELRCAARLHHEPTRWLVPSTVKERAIAKKSYAEFLKHYDSQPADAKKLLAGRRVESRSEPVNAAELAAMTMLANQVLNLDEVLNK